MTVFSSIFRFLLFLGLITGSLNASENNTFTIRHNNAVKQFGDHKVPLVSRGLKVDSQGFLDAVNTDDDDSLYLRMEGDFLFSEVTQKEIYFNLTWAKAKLWIDDKEITQVHSTNQQVPYQFSVGKHHIKILVYNTDSAAAIVHIGMIDHQQQPLTDKEASEQLKNIIDDKPICLNYFYRWHSKTVELKASATDSILFITSFKPATYTIKNAKRARLKAIVYSGEGVEFQSDEPITILRVQKIPEAPNLSPNIKECSSLLGGLICPDEQNFMVLNRWINSVTGKSLDGFTNSREQDNLPIIVPEIVLDKLMYQKLNDIQNEIQAKRQYLEKASSSPYFLDSNVSWTELLKIKPSSIPTNKFRAFYMDKNSPKKIQYSEVVDALSLTYSHEPFHTILADNFLGLWIGNFTFEKETHLNINVSVSWAHIKITDNGKIIYEGGDSSQIEHVFSKGTHKIEVEYINNYGQVDVNMGFIKSVPMLDENITRSLITPDTNVYLFGGYESERNDHGVDFVLQNSSRPTVLFLSSYETINYTIRNVRGGKLKAIIYNSNEPLGEIKTDSDIPIYRDVQLSYCDRLIPFSYKPQINSFENERAFPHAIAHIQQLTGMKPRGFSSMYEPSLSDKRLERVDQNKPISIPQIILDEGMYKKIEDRLNFLKTH